MDRDDTLGRALDALGGIDRIRAVRTYVARGARDDEAGRADVSVWRAAGGRVRLEERRDGRTIVRIVVGDAGTLIERTADGSQIARPLGADEVRAIRRDARVAPRNFLAHAEEYDLAPGRPCELDGRGAVRVDFDAERARYFFDRATWLCLALEDLAAGRTVRFDDYREIDGIVTPFVERADAAVTCYESIRYNAEVDDDRFAI